MLRIGSNVYCIEDESIRGVIVRFEDERTVAIVEDGNGDRHHVPVPDLERV